MTRFRASLARLDINRLAGLVLWFVLLVAVLAIPLQIRNFVLPVISIARLALAPELQTRAALGDLPYEILLKSNELLPVGAGMLLVTDGADVRHREYTTFHRALYYLTPRPVWWLSAAPADGTWESRWWHSAPLTEPAISEFAHSKNVDFILLLANQNLFPSKHTLARWQGARLVQIDGDYLGQAPSFAPEFAPPDWGWRVLSALLLFLLTGALVVAFLSRRGFILSRIELFALSWCLGVGLITFLLLAFLGIGLSLTSSVWVMAGLAITTAILLGVTRVFSLQSSASTSFWRAVSATRNHGRKLFPMFPPVTISRRGIVALILLAILLLQIAYVALIALGQPLTYWDSWVTWGIKARTLFIDQTLSPALLTDVSRAITHLDYPLLLPLAEATLFRALGAVDDRFVGWIALGFFLALVALVYAASRMFGATRSRALLASTVVGALPTVALLAAENYADIPLAVYGIVTVTYLLRWILRGERGALIVAIFGSACLAWTKREGLVLALAISFAAVALFPRVRRARVGTFACAVASSLISVSWTLWLSTQGTTNTDLSPITISTLQQNLDRIPPILFYFAATLVSPQWAFVWLCAALVLLLRLAWPADAAYDLYLASAFLYVAIMSSTYLFSDYAPYTAHLANSGYRLIAHVTPFIIIWLALQRAPIANPHSLYTPG